MQRQKRIDRDADAENGRERESRRKIEVGGWGGRHQNKYGNKT